MLYEKKRHLLTVPVRSYPMQRPLPVLIEEKYPEVQECILQSLPHRNAYHIPQLKEHEYNIYFLNY